MANKHPNPLFIKRKRGKYVPPITREDLEEAMKEYFIGGGRIKKLDVDERK